MLLVNPHQKQVQTVGGGRGSSQCLLLVNPHKKQEQTNGRGGDEGELPCLLLVKPHQKQVQTWGEGELPVFTVSKSTSKAGTDLGGGGAPSIYC